MNSLKLAALIPDNRPDQGVYTYNELADIAQGFVALAVRTLIEQADVVFENGRINLTWGPDDTPAQKVARLAPQVGVLWQLNNGDPAIRLATRT